MASSLAGKVRRAAESDDFDLGGYDQAKCGDLVKAAFSEPFPLKEMVRLSFTVGGGKLVRQKYSDDLPKIFMGALTAGGYTEDGSATVEAGSAGKFKYHHDTNKNLKFVHVFPKLGGGEASAEGAYGDEDEEEQEESSTPEDLLFRSEGKEFLRLVQTHLTTYAQKKKLMEMFKQRVSSLEAIEQKMSKLERLEAAEEALFDDVGVEELKEKNKLLSAELQGMVDAGQLTTEEKNDFLEQLDSKRALIDAEIAKAEADGKAKKVHALTQQRESLEKTRAAIKDAASASLPPIKNGAGIRELHAKLAQLARIEKASKGNYSMAELKQLGERPEIEEALAELEGTARNWLESDEVFKKRLEANLRAGGGIKKSGGGSSSGGGGRGSGGGGYTAVSGGARAPKAKAGGPAMRNAFGALG